MRMRDFCFFYCCCLEKGYDDDDDCAYVFSMVIKQSTSLLCKSISLFFSIILILWSFFFLVPWIQLRFSMKNKVKHLNMNQTGEVLGSLVDCFNQFTSFI